METKITKFSQISNKIFLIVSVYLLSFVWIEYKLHSIKNALLLTIPITLFTLLILFYISKIRSAKKGQISLQEKNKEHLFNQLMWGKEDTINKFILSEFGYENLTKTNFNHYENKDLSIYFKFDKEILDNYELASIIRSETKSSVIIFCLNSNVTILPEGKEICIIDFNKLYQIIGVNIGDIPTNVNIKKKPKYRLKDILCIALNKSRSKGYFMSSILLIFLSLFTPYNIYYIVACSILLLLAIYSRFNIKFN